MPMPETNQITKKRDKTIPRYLWESMIHLRNVDIGQPVIIFSRLLGPRQRNPETASGACRLERETAAVHFDGPFGNRKAQTCSSMLARAGRIDTVKPVKDS